MHHKLNFPFVLSSNFKFTIIDIPDTKISLSF